MALNLVDGLRRDHLDRALGVLRARRLHDGRAVDHYGWSQGWTLYVAAVLGFVVGCATSLPALRLKGVYLALVTLGLAVLFPQLVKWQKAAWLTDGARGIDRHRATTTSRRGRSSASCGAATGARCSCGGSRCIVLVLSLPRVPRHREEPSRAVADRDPRQRDRRSGDGRQPRPDQDARVRRLRRDVRRPAARCSRSAATSPARIRATSR